MSVTLLRLNYFRFKMKTRFNKTKLITAVVALVGAAVTFFSGGDPSRYLKSFVTAITGSVSITADSSRDASRTAERIERTQRTATRSTTASTAADTKTETASASASSSSSSASSGRNEFDFKGLGNTQEESFYNAKKALERKVYKEDASRVTLYCGYSYDKNKNIKADRGFRTPAFPERAGRVTWEHVVPAENFGRNFAAWTRGNEKCTENGNPFKGRRCAEQISASFRLMQADMYNLYPADGAVNAVRANYDFKELPGVAATFGTCSMKVKGNAAEPPEAARGRIARSTLYMAETYAPAYRPAAGTLSLMRKWNEKYPATQWECTRAARIEQIQGNRNHFVVDACRAQGLRYGE